MIKLEKAVERQEWLPMPLTHSAHPREESERFSRDFTLEAAMHTFPTP